MADPAGRTPAQRVVGDVIVAPVAVPICLLAGLGEVEMAHQQYYGTPLVPVAEFAPPPEFNWNSVSHHRTHFGSPI